MIRKSNAISRMPVLLFGCFATVFANAQESSQAEEKNSAIEGRILEEVVVTVERREQSLQDYAGTAQAFDAADLARDGIGSEFKNLSYAVPGLNIANQEGNLEVFIRGVGSSNNTELGDPAVATHINGVYVTRPRGLGSQFFDIERVEVNKGPQGTLRGRNAVGGSVNIITNKPLIGDYEGYMQAEFASFNQRTFHGAVSLPVSENSAVRIAGFSETRDPTFENAGVNTNLTAAGQEDELAGRVSFLSNPNDNLSIYLVADVVEEGGTGYPGANVFNALSSGQGFTVDSLDPRQVVYRGTQGKLDNKVKGFSANVAYDFGSVGVEYIGSTRELDFEQTNASNDQIFFPGRDVSINGVNYDNYSTVYWQQESKADTHELRFYSTDDDSPLFWSAGIFSLQEDQNTGFFSLNDNGIFFSGVEFTMPIVEAESEAIYFDFTYDITDQFRVKSGVRYTEESKFRSGIGGNWTLGLGSDGGCCFTTRLGTPGFIPAFQDRPTFTAPTNNAEAAQFLIDGALSFGANDTLVSQLAGVVDGTAPNGTCVDRFDTNGGGSQNCLPNGQHSFFVVGAPGAQIGETSEDYVDWRLGFEWDLSDNNLIYATVSTGTKSGGFNDNIGNFAPEFLPEELTAYEIGSKNSLSISGTDLLLNLSAFYYDYRDQVFQTLASTSTATDGTSDGFSLLNQNAADSEVLGLEIETAVELPYGLQFAGNILLLDTEIKSGSLADVRGQDFGVSPTVSNIDLSGNPLPLASDVTAVLKLGQTLDIFKGIADWQLLANYRSSYNLSPFSDDPIARPAGSTICGSNDARFCGFEQKQDGFWTVNLNVGFEPEGLPVRLEAFVTNLTDETVSQKALIGNGLNLRFLNSPRTAGVRLNYNF